MADKIAAVQVYGCISSVYISFQVIEFIEIRRMPASMLGFLVVITQLLPIFTCITVARCIADFDDVSINIACCLLTICSVK